MAKRNNNRRHATSEKSSGPRSIPNPSELYCRDVGRGDVILFLHAFPLNSRMWQPQIDALQSQARILAPDFPGFGLTPASSNSTSFATYAADISALLRRLDVNRVTVVGLAEGTCIALHLVEELGPKLHGLVLSSPYIEPNTSEAKSRLESLVAEVLLDGHVDPALNEFLPKLIGPTSQRSKPHLFDEVESIIRESTPAGVAAGLSSLATRPDYRPFLAKIRCPVLCLGGEEDTLSPPETLSHTTGQIPGALSKVIPECGRLSNLESPEVFNDAVVSLIAESLPSRTIS